MAKRPKVRYPKEHIAASVDRDTVLLLEMLGFDVKALVAELLAKVAEQRKCPCCGREVRPVIVRR